MRRTAIAVHGGAWAIPAARRALSRRGCELAAETGYKVLVGGGCALDAVEAAVRVLEDDPVFDAGRGSVLTASRNVEMDAAIQCGDTLDAGAVACIGGVRNPVSVARLVLKHSDNVLLVGRGAVAFAEEMGVPRVSEDWLVTPEAEAEWEEMATFNRAVGLGFNVLVEESKRAADSPRPGGCDTVGAVALDSEGRTAAATSTGGITMKRDGRVGDSPILGCGLYADNRLGSVSTTGHGESILKTTLARRALDLAQQQGIQGGVEAALHEMRERVGGCGGLVALDPSGTVGCSWTTPTMAWASVNTAGELASGCDGDQ